MPNYYLQTVFNIPVTAEEATLLEECFAVSIHLCENLAELPANGMQAVKDYYASRSEAFRTTFPTKPEEEDPFAGFFDLWSDPCNPAFDADLSIRNDSEDKHPLALISGHEVDVHALASLIQKVCKSALPLGFQWANVADRDVPDAFGGGYYVITDREIFGGSTSWLMDETLQTLRAGA